MIGETGSVEDAANPAAKAAWFDNAARDLTTEMPNVQALIYFDAKKACDYRVATSARSLDGFRRLALDPHFQTTPLPPTSTTRPTSTTAPTSSTRPPPLVHPADQLAGLRRRVVARAGRLHQRHGPQLGRPLGHQQVRQGLGRPRWGGSSTSSTSTTSGARTSRPPRSAPWPPRAGCC